MKRNQKVNGNGTLKCEFAIILETFKFENELKEMRKIIDKSIVSILQTGADLSESGNYTESQEFAQVLKGFLHLDDRIKKDAALCEEFEKKLRSVGGIEEAREILTESTPITRMKWPSVPEMKEYNELTWECGPGFGNRQGYPSFENDSGIQDDDLVMQSRDSLMCPISQGLLREPVKNPPCGHTFSKEMIERLFGIQQAAIACPVSGCRASVLKRNLVKDEKLERKLERVSERIFK